MIKSFNAAGDIDCYRFCKLTPNGLETAISSSDATIGVSTSAKYSTGEAADVCIMDECFIEAGGAFEIGDFLTSDSTGRAIKAGSGNIGAIALAKAGAEGDIVSVIAIISATTVNTASADENTQDEITQDESTQE